MGSEVAFMCSASEQMMRIIEDSTWLNSQDVVDLDTNYLSQAALNGIVALYRHDRVVFCLSRQTAYIGRVDVFVPQGVSVYDCIRAGQSFMSWATSETEYERLEARSPERFIVVLGKRCGWKLDATIPHSYATDNGMVSEYLMGWTRPEGVRRWHQ